MIDTFHGEFAFLSNFAACWVSLDGVNYPSVEHAYQAAKTLDPEARRTVAQAAHAGSAKKLGKTLAMRPDWDAVKFEVMRNLLRQKFAPGTRYAQQLLATGEQPLVEGNYWGDTVWGVCRGQGENHLGRLLMEQRAYLQTLPSDPFVI